MDFLNTIIPFVTSALIGLLMGIDREKNKQYAQNLSQIGVRTSIFISLLGSIAGYLGQIISPVVFYICTVTIVILILSSHIYLIVKHNRIGITTEISSFLLYLYGAMCTYGMIQLAVGLGIITTLILSTRSYLHAFTENISTNELFDTIKFAIISFIILPFLPDKNFDSQILGFLLPQGGNMQFDVLNPYRIWFLVVFVSGVSFLGYVLIKVLGKRAGISLTGLMGGLYSSTATSLTLVHKSKELLSLINPFVAGIILACASSYIKTFIFIRALNAELFARLLVPIGLMFVYLLGAGFFMMFRSHEKPAEKALDMRTHSADSGSRNDKETGKKDENFQSPFSLKSAVKLAGFIVASLLVAKISLSYAGIELYYIVAVLCALLAVDDPIVVSTSATAGTLIDYNNAKNIILLVIFLNMIQKIGIAYMFGNRKLVKPLVYIFAGLLLVTVVGFLYL